MSRPSPLIIDVSHHQNPALMNYDRLAQQVDHVIVRTQDGSRVLDRHYKTHHAEFRKRGIPTAAYAFARGISIKDMEVEATDFYNRTKDLKPTFWWVDVEVQSMQDMRAGVSAYVRKLRQLGAHKVGVYIAHHLYRTFNLKLDEFDAIWIPRYGVNNGQVSTSPDYPCDLHQYTEKGKLDGYSGYLDLNRIASNKPLSFFTGQEQQAPSKEGSYSLDPKDANTIIQTWLGPAWNFSQSEVDKKELNRLANEIRKSAGLPTQ